MLSTAVSLLKTKYRHRIAIKPSTQDEHGNKLHYHHGDNKLAMYPRHITEEKTRGYHLLNVGMDYENVIGNYDYTLSLRANNLLNQKVYIHNSFLPHVPQMGHNVVMSLAVKFWF